MNWTRGFPTRTLSDNESFAPEPIGFQADLDPLDVLDTGALIDETQPEDELRPG